MSHYFDDAPVVPSAPSTIVVDVPGAHFTLATDRGVFSHRRLDPGTEVLLRRAPALPSHGYLLDLGCGSGAIALTLATRSPEATVWAIDVNARARSLCAANASTNGLTNVRIAEPSGVPADVRFDAIWSNPPIHAGKQVLHELLRAWLPRLQPDGHALLVVHKHLGSDSLHRWLEHQGWLVARAASAKGYRVLDVVLRAE